MRNKIPYIIGASTIALFSLILIQVKWMQQSRNLIEAQFDQKVSMALCQAVESMSPFDEDGTPVLICGSDSGTKLTTSLDSPAAFDEVKEKVAFALARYQINMPFELDLYENGRALFTTTKEDEQVYSCALDPMASLKSEELSIRFPDKQAYVLGQMSLMLVLSICILLFITGVFIYANYHLFRQKQLSERNKEFFNHMAHEFKTPLTNIGLAAKMLRKQPNERLINIISTESQELDTQVNRVLTMASLEAGNYELTMEKVEVTAWIKKLLSSMEMQLKNKGAKVKIVDEDIALYIEADRFHLANAIRNVLGNALKYCTAQPEIEISIRSISGKVRISILDNGIGISPEKQKLVFDKFYRVKQSEGQNNKGFGLGLSYVQKIVELHKGQLKVESEQNQWTRFDLIIPQKTAYAGI